MATQSFSFPPPPPPPPKRNPIPPNSEKGSYGIGSGFPVGSSTYSGNQYYGRRTVTTQRGGYSRPPTRGFHQGHISSVPGNTSSFSQGFEHTPARHVPNGNRGFKRNHSTAFSNRNQMQARPQAAPSVPSFNAIIENLLPKTQEPTIKNSSNNPKYTKPQNVLGLTPSRVDSESEDEGDEETKLSKSVGTGSLQFEYNGQMSTLSSASDVAAWIAERRKRYPTQAKIEAARKQAQEKKRLWEEDRKAKLEQSKAGKKIKTPRYVQSSEVSAGPGKKDPSQGRITDVDGRTARDPVLQAKLKEENLRRKALKYERRLAQTRDALKLVENQQTSVVGLGTQAQEKDGDIVSPQSQDDAMKSTEARPEGRSESTIHSDGNQAKLMAVVEEAANKNSQHTSNDQYLPTNSQISSPDSSVTSDSDPTSSSGSSESDSDSAPEESTTKRHRNADVPMPVKQSLPLKETKLCRNLARYGRCRYGSKCRNSHDLTSQLVKRGAKTTQPTVPSRRKGLWQVMVEKEKEERQRQILRVIIALGENGLLEEPETLKSVPLTNEAKNASSMSGTN